MLYFKSNLFGAFLLFVVFNLFSNVSSKSTPKIGVIGGGAGGASLTYFLNDLLKNNVEIDVFEKEPALGGRLKIINVNGNWYETGGSIIHPRNKLASELSEKFKFERQRDSISRTMSLLKDNEYIFTTSKWSIVTLMQFLYRYGFQVRKLYTMTESFIDDFSKIYKSFDKGESYPNALDLLNFMNPKFLNISTQVFDEFLRKNEFSEKFIGEMVEAITLVNYGQISHHLHGFVGSVSIAGGSTSDLWSIKGGNKELPTALFNSSTEANKKVKINLKTKIDKITKNEDGTFSLGNSDKKYDKVVFAFPFDNSIEFKNFGETPEEKFDPTIEIPLIKYHRTVSTLISGKLRKELIDYGDIISISPESNFYTCISRVYPVKLYLAETLAVYKIFSPLPLTKEQINSLFEEVIFIDTADWLAYPEYKDIHINNVPAFEPFENIYYLNSIEQVASAIEMSLISGRNIANLIAQDYIKMDSSSNKSQKKKKEEL